jgi:hypothetical protein
MSSRLAGPWALEYSDFHVCHEQNERYSQEYNCTKRFWDAFVTGFIRGFQYFVPIGPKNFLFAKFELVYQKYAEFHADSETVEKKVTVEHSRLFVPFYPYCFTEDFRK